MCMRAIRTEGQPGSALAMTLLVMVAIAIMTIGLCVIALSSTGMMVDTEDRENAWLIAQTGIALGFKNLNTSTFASLPNGTIIIPAPGDPAGIAYSPAPSDPPGMAYPGGNNVLSLGTQRVVQVIKSTNAAGFPTLVSYGIIEKKLVVGNVTYVSRSIEAVIGITPVVGVFPGGGFGLASLGIIGNFSADSYDSSKGPYDPAKAGNQGNLGTNGPVTISGNAFFVNGNVNPGPGQPPVVNGNITGSGAPLLVPYKISIPQYIVPPGANTNYSTTMGTTGAVTNYHFASLSTQHNDMLLVNGTVNMYVDGAIDLKGDLRLADQNAILNIYQLAGTITINGGGTSNSELVTTIPAQTIDHPATTTNVPASTRTVAASNSNQAPPALNPGETAPVPTLKGNGKVDYWTITTPASTVVVPAWTETIPAYTVSTVGGIPGHFNLISSTTDVVKLNGNADYYGTMVAPYAELDILGTSSKFGAFIGNVLKLGGTGNFHNDINARSPAISAKPVLLSYREK